MKDNLSTPEEIAEKILSSPENWPAEFYVCARHKQEFFEDYESAKVHPNAAFCELCHGRDNDSLGG